MRRMRGRPTGGHGSAGHGSSGNNGGGGGSPLQGGGGGNSGSGSRRSGVPNRHQVFDSNGPEVRIRGNAWQVFEKYQALARDSQSSGDRVRTESYLQHAEHYYRIMLSITEALEEANAHQQQRQPQQRSFTPPDMMEDRSGASFAAPESSAVMMQQPAVGMAPPLSLDPGRMPQPSTDDLPLMARSEGVGA